MPTDETVQPTNPYPGFRPFEPEDEDFFFGRESNTDELLGRLHESRLCAVIGVSGSGKSSLVRAGVIPELRAGFLAGEAAGWCIAVMRPGVAPVAGLAKALDAADVAGQAPDGADGEGPDTALRRRLLEVTLRRGSHGLVEAVREMHLEPGAHFLLVVDQFEELFRLKRAADIEHGEDEARAFVTLLLAAAEQSDIPVYIIITMRSDFIGDCSDFPNLTRAVNNGGYLVPMMTRREMRLAIEGPARVVGERMSQRLVQRVLNEVGDDPGQLPLLQHALMRTFDAFRAAGSQGEVDFSHYEAVGGLRHALAWHAEEAFEVLAGGERRLCERIFRALTVRGPGHSGIRRPTAVAALAEIVACSVGEVRMIVDGFRRTGRSFLLPGPAVPLEPDTVIDIAHESLMRAWPRLAQWVEAESESATVFTRLAEAAELHARGEGPRYWDPALQIALDWRERDEPNEAWARQYRGGFALAIEFLESSDVKKHEVINSIRAARAGSVRTSRTVTFGFIALFVLSVAIALFSYFGLEQARQVAQRTASYGSSVEQLGWRVERDLLEARRREKDFLLRWEREGIQQAKRLYARKNEEHLNAIEASVEQLETHLAREIAEGERALAAGKDSGELVKGARALLEQDRQMRAQVALYRAKFGAVVALSERRGFQDTGLEGEFRQKVHQVQRLLGPGADSDDSRELFAQVLEVRRREKDFMLRRGETEVEQVRVEVAKLVSALDRSSLDLGERVMVASLMSDYAAKFDEYVKASQSLDQTIEEMRDAAARIQSVAADIRERGIQESLAAAARAALEYQWQVTIGKIVLAILACVLAIGVVLALVLFAQLRQPDEIAQLLGLSDAATLD